MTHAEGHSAVAEEPQLAPPGAGLPPGELAVARVLTRLYRAVTTPRMAMRRFRTEGRRIALLAEDTAAHEAGPRILVRRLPGIEDSSRFWSVYMVLDHLAIVDEAVAQMITTLAAGGTYANEVRIAEIKPAVDAGPDAIGRFEKVAHAYEREIGSLGRLRGRARHAHPWFGALDAHGWHCLAAVHHTVHRRQIEAILRAIRAA